MQVLVFTCSIYYLYHVHSIPYLFLESFTPPIHYESLQICEYGGSGDLGTMTELQYISVDTLLCVCQQV